MRLNYIRTLNHRGEFFSGLFGSLAWGVLSVVTIHVLTSRSDTVYGWSRNELFILIGVTNIIVGSLLRMFNAENFDRMSSTIQHGDLDAILLKPIDSQFMLSFLYIKLHGFIRLFISIVFTFLMLNLAAIPITAFSIISFVFFAILGYLIIYSIWFLVMTFAIRFPDLHNLSEILYTADGITRYPPQVLWATKIFLFLIFIPYTLVVSIPTKALIHKLTFMDSLVTIGTATILFLVSRALWKFALRYYSSAS